MKTFYSQRIPQGSLKYPIEFFNSIPIPIIPNNLDLLLKDYVEKICCNCNTFSNEKKEHLYNQIDILVYKLYNLTYDEVKIIDPEIENLISREDYDAEVGGI